MTYYYVHGESGCAFLSQEHPSVVTDGEPLVDVVDRDHYLRACEELGLRPDPHPDPCEETRRRIRVSVAAWAYEVHSDPIMSDGDFDALSREIDTLRSTARSEMDHWFMEHFSPNTGMWVHQHPEPEGLERIYQMLRRSTLKNAVSMDIGTLMQWASAA